MNCVKCKKWSGDYRMCVDCRKIRDVQIACMKNRRQDYSKMKRRGKKGVRLYHSIA